jgi:signal transduction histidine kinase
LYLNIIGVPLFNKNNEVEEAISMAIDNTETVLAKKRLEELNRTLEKKIDERTQQLYEANQELNQVLDLKSKFISDASHELRTPLTIIQGNLDLATTELRSSNKKVPEAYTLINKEVSHMTNILTDLTVLSNTDANSEKYNYDKINLPLLLLDITTSLGVLAKQKDITIHLDKKPENLYIMGDETKIEKALLNLIRNAIKYTDCNGEIKIWLENNETEAIINISDTGIGIPAEDLPYIFERFYRVDKARSRQEGGSGLGLAIVKSIIEAHQGHIEVKSEAGIGSTFIIYLPLNLSKPKE